MLYILPLAKAQARLEMVGGLNALTQQLHQIVNCDNEGSEMEREDRVALTVCIIRTISAASFANGTK